MPQDKLLEGRGISAENESFLPIGLVMGKKFYNINYKILECVSAYLQLIWTIRRQKDGTKDCSIDVAVIDILENTKAFLNGSLQNDKFWVEHCAASLREVIYDLSPDDFCKCFKNIDKESEFFITSFNLLIKIKQYLSELTHFRYSVAKKKASEILDFDIKNKSKEEIFELVGVELIYVLYRLFCAYCYKS